jgi:hypothetical protein
MTTLAAALAALTLLAAAAPSDPSGCDPSHLAEPCPDIEADELEDVDELDDAEQDADEAIAEDDTEDEDGADL